MVKYEWKDTNKDCMDLRVLGTILDVDGQKSR